MAVAHTPTQIQIQIPDIINDNNYLILSGNPKSQLPWENFTGVLFVTPLEHSFHAITCENIKSYIYNKDFTNAKELGLTLCKFIDMIINSTLSVAVRKQYEADILFN